MRSGPSTRQALVRAAHSLFTEKGFAQVSLGKIAKEAGHTEGALFHYFKNKQDIYRLVVTQVHKRFQTKLAKESAKTDDAFASLLNRVRLSLRLSKQSSSLQKLLREAPIHLGYDEWRKIDTDVSLAILEPQLRDIVENNNIPAKKIRLMAYIILGITNEFCLAQVRENEEISEEDMVNAIEEFISAWVSKVD